MYAIRQENSFCNERSGRNAVRFGVLSSQADQSQPRHEPLGASDAQAITWLRMRAVCPLLGDDAGRVYYSSVSSLPSESGLGPLSRKHRGVLNVFIGYPVDFTGMYNYATHFW